MLLPRSQAGRHGRALGTSGFIVQQFLIFSGNPVRSAVAT
jgi:hypothetical protein